jgi:hypothetical protein
VTAGVLQLLGSALSFTLTRRPMGETVIPPAGFGRPLPAADD